MPAVIGSEPIGFPPLKNLPPRPTKRHPEWIKGPAMYTRKPFEPDDNITANPAERRTVKRRHLIYYLRVWDADSGEILGHLVDITTGGLMMVSEQDIPLDKDFTLEMRWHDEQEKKQTVHFHAHSRWRSKDVNPLFSDTGFELTDTDTSVLQPIQQLIDEYGFQD